MYLIFAIENHFILAKWPLVASSTSGPVLVYDLLKVISHANLKLFADSVTLYKELPVTVP